MTAKTHQDIILSLLKEKVEDNRYLAQFLPDIQLQNLSDLEKYSPQDFRTLINDLAAEYKDKIPSKSKLTPNQINKFRSTNLFKEALEAERNEMIFNTPVGFTSDKQIEYDSILRKSERDAQYERLQKEHDLRLAKQVEATNASQAIQEPTPTSSPAASESSIYAENIPTPRNADTVFSGEFREKYSRDNFQSAWDKRNQLANEIREFRKSHKMKSYDYEIEGLSKDDAERFKELITEKKKIDTGIKEQIRARKGIFAEGRMEDLDAQIKGLNKNDPFYASKKEILESQKEVARGQFSAGAKLQEARYSSEYNKNMRRLSKMNPDSPEAMALFERNRGIKENMNKITRKLNAPSGGKWSTFKKVGMGALGVLALAGVANMMFAGGERKNAELYNPNAAFQYA